MTRSAGRPARVRLVWERGVRVKFHYTEPGFAERVMAELLFRVGTEPGRAGYGLYATTVQPRALPDDKLLDLLFARGRPTTCVEGVVVLRDDALPWIRYSHRKYVHKTRPGAVVDLSLVLVGIGIRHMGAWLWSEGLYAPASRA